MKTVVITGSGRGLGFEMAKVFHRNNYNVVLNDINEQRLLDAQKELAAMPGEGKVHICVANIASNEDLGKLWESAVEVFGTVDIWINNAGVNQPMRAIWELTEGEINAVLDIDLRGAIMGSRLAMQKMIEQGHGAIYNVEGYGSNDAKMLGLNLYGTSKRAVTHFTQALALESAERNTNVLVGLISPGIMITDFTVKALGDKEAIDLPEKTKKVYNILGDYPDVVAEFLVAGMLKNTKNNAKIEWLTNGKAAWRFMTAGFNKRNFFE